jgi:glycosyltransferase involved in cell wall biosynthesis
MPAFKQPCITILLPTYNAEAFIKETIKSILAQTYSNWECLIIDDASTDQTVQIIKRFKDKRIQLIEKPKNSGYTNSLNQGLQCAKGKYIARMDADDIALPQRLERQYQFMESHPEVVVCGTAYRILGTERTVTMPLDNKSIKNQLLKQTCFAHPTVMLRKKILIDNNLKYNIEKEPAEDYDLWVRLLSFGKMANIKEVLLEYRLHDNQVSIIRRQRQLESKYQTRINILKYVDNEISEQEANILRNTFQNGLSTFKELKQLAGLIDRLTCKNKEVKFFAHYAFKDYLKDLETKQLMAYFLKRSKFTPLTWMRYVNRYRSRSFRLPLKSAAIIAVKSGLYINDKEK